MSVVAQQVCSVWSSVVTAIDGRWWRAAFARSYRVLVMNVQQNEFKCELDFTNEVHIAGKKRI